MSFPGNHYSGGIQTAFVLLTNTDLPTLNTTPQLAIDAPGRMTQFPLGQPNAYNFCIDVIKATCWFDYNGIYYPYDGVTSFGCTLNVSLYNPANSNIEPILTNSTACVNPNSCFQDFTSVPVSQGVTKYAPGLGIYLTTPQAISGQNGSPPYVGGVPHAHVRIWIYYQILPYTADLYLLGNAPTL